MQPNREYSSYSVQDFVMDDYFRQWVLHPTENTEAFWNAWQIEHLEKKILLEEARHLVLHLSFRQEHMPQESTERIWNKLESVFNSLQDQLHSQDVPQTSLHKPTKKQPLWYAAAAAVLVFFTISALIYFIAIPAQSSLSYTTPYGQTKMVLLPDSSTVTLNANSTIRFSPVWTAGETREVWLAGEAYFNVLKKKSGSGQRKFIVHTGPLHVEVLGTTFTVNSRRGNTKVVLNSGKVKLAGEEARLAGTLVMQPGEYVEYSKKARKLTRKRVDPAKYSSWTQDKLIFDNTPLHEVAQLMEDNFGLKVQLNNASLANRGFTATLPANNVQTLLTVLEETFGLKITRKNDLVILDTH